MSRGHFANLAKYLCSCRGFIGHAHYQQRKLSNSCALKTAETQYWSHKQPIHTAAWQTQDRPLTCMCMCTAPSSHHAHDHVADAAAVQKTVRFSADLAQSVDSMSLRELKALLRNVDFSRCIEKVRSASLPGNVLMNWTVFQYFERIINVEYGCG